MFKQAPENLLNMIVVHELAHLKEKDHNKSFYQLCRHMQPDYHQLEFDTRLYLIQLETYGAIYEPVRTRTLKSGCVTHAGESKRDLIEEFLAAGKHQKKHQTEQRDTGGHLKH